MHRARSYFQWRHITILVALALVSVIATKVSTESDGSGANANVVSEIDSEVDSALCGTTSYSQTTFPPSPEALAWTSDQVVVGKVVEELPPTWGEPIMTGAEETFDGKSLRGIYTEYAIQIEERIRGQEYGFIRTRISGGTIGECTIGSDSVGLSVGDRLLLFLSSGNAPEAADDPFGPAYYLTHLRTGVWDFVDEHNVAPRIFVEAAEAQAAETSPALEHFTHSWTDMRSSMRAALTSGDLPPGDSTMGVPIIPLDVAPISDR